MHVTEVHTSYLTRSVTLCFAVTHRHVLNHSHKRFWYLARQRIPFMLRLRADRFSEKSLLAQLTDGVSAFGWIAEHGSHKVSHGCGALPAHSLYASTCAPFILAEKTLNVVVTEFLAKLVSLSLSHDALQPRAGGVCCFAQHQFPSRSASRESCRSTTGGVCRTSTRRECICPVLVVCCVAPAPAVCTFHVLAASHVAAHAAVHAAPVAVMEYFSCCSKLRSFSAPFAMYMITQRLRCTQHRHQLRSTSLQSSSAVHRLEPHSLNIELVTFD